MLLWATFDQDSVIVRVKILDSAVATGAGKTGLTSASSGLIISTIADSEATAVTYTVAGSTIETITTLGTYAAPTATKCRFKEVDATNHKGVYELQFANARFAIAGAKSLLISILGATGAAECDAVIPLPTVDLFTAITYPANFSTLAIDGSGQVTTGSVAAGGITAASFGANAINAAKLDPDVTTELQSGLATAAALATVDGIVDDILLDTAEIGAAGAGLTAINLPNQTMDITGNITGNLSGSVGSVTTVSDKTGYRLSSTGVADILTTALTESYAADGAAGTLTQMLYAIQQFLHEQGVSGTTVTVKKLDGSTTAYTLTMNDADDPTGVTRAS